MKNAMIFAMLFMMTLTTSFKAIANGDNENSNSPLTVKNVSNGKYSLLYTSNNPENVRVNISNERGELLHTDYIRNKNGFKLPYDLRNLPEGNYQVKVMTDKNSFSTVIHHTNEKAPFFKAFFQSEGKKNKYKVNVIRHSMQPVNITIFDKNKQVLFTETVDVDYNFSRIYNLNKYSIDARYITVMSGNNMVEYIIKN